MHALPFHSLFWRSGHAIDTRIFSPYHMMCVSYVRRICSESFQYVIVNRFNESWLSYVSMMCDILLLLLLLLFQFHCSLFAQVSQPIVCVHSTLQWTHSHFMLNRLRCDILVIFFFWWVSGSSARAMLTQCLNFLWSFLNSFSLYIQFNAIGVFYLFCLLFRHIFTLASWTCFVLIASIRLLSDPEFVIYSLQIHAHWTLFASHISQPPTAAVHPMIARKSKKKRN